MTVLPVSVTRTSEFLTNKRLTGQVNKNAADLQSLYNQLSTGRRLEYASDDAPAAARANSMQRSLQYAEQLVRNAQASQRFLNATDGLLADVGSSLIEARASVNLAAQTTISDEERQTVADNLALLMEQIVNDGNRTFENHSLLSGVKGGAALLAEDKYITLQANDSLLESFRSFDQVSPQSSNVLQAFGFGKNVIRSNVDLRPGISADSLLSDLNNGAGIDLGTLRIFDSGPGEWKSVDLSGTRTVGELIQKVQAVQVAGRELRVGITSDRLTINFADGLAGTLAIDEAFGGNTANSLGWLNRNGFNSPPLGNRQSTPELGIHSRIDTLAGGAGIDLSAGILIRQGDETYPIDLSQAETVGDVLIAINRSDAGVHASIDTANGRLVIQSLRAGVDFSVGENGGTVAGDLGLRSGSLTTRLDELLHGSGIQQVSGAEFTITRSDGSELAIDLDGVTDIAGVIDAINNHVDNSGPQSVVASLSSVGNSVVLESATGTGPLVIRSHDASNAAVALGLVQKGSNSTTVEAEAGVIRLVGKDFSGRQPGGIIDDLIRLDHATRNSDFGEIERLQKLVDDGLDSLNRIRAGLGVQTQASLAAQTRFEDDSVRLKQGISENLDADLTAVISQVSLRQAAMEASLQIMGKMSGLTLLNYL